MSDWDSIQADSIQDIIYEKMNNKTEDDLRYDAFELVEEDILNNCYYKVISDYNLLNYLNDVVQWDNLPINKKIEYCYDLLFEERTDEFPILRQVDIFQKLVNLDYIKFDYHKVLQCAFFDNKTLDDIDCISSAHTTINIPFHPLIPYKYYANYIKKLNKNNKIKILEIPIDDAYNYLKETLSMWFEHKYYNKTAYTIAKESTVSIDPKTIERRLKKISLLKR